MTDSLTKPQSSAISEHSSVTGTPAHIRTWLTSSPAGSRASRSASPDGSAAQTTNATCGRPQSHASAQYDHSTRSWKTCQGWLLPDILAPSWETWPKAGMTLDGAFYPLPRWERRIAGIDYGYLPTPVDPSKGGGSSRSGDRINETPTLHGMARKGLWPTPVAQDDNKSPEAHLRMKRRMKGGPRKTITSLNVMVKAIEQGMWPTPQAADAKRKGADYARANRPKSGGDDLNTAVSRTGEPGGQLNPTWVEWLMGWPIGWTDLKPLATAKFRQWLQQHGIY